MSKKKRPDPASQVRFEPNREGMEAVMGPLEARVMNVIWELGEGTVREVWEHLGGKKNAAYTTIMTIFHRLHEKGFVERESVGRAHLYRPCSSRPEFQGNVLSRVLQGVLGQVRKNKPLGLIGRLKKKDRELLRKMLNDADRDS